jgi:hypothetical protein
VRVPQQPAHVRQLISDERAHAGGASTMAWRDPDRQQGAARKWGTIAALSGQITQVVHRNGFFTGA